MPTTAKLFRNGGSQAVRLPAEFRFEGTEVIVEKVGDSLVLRPAKPDWDSFFDDVETAPDDFMIDREDAPPQRRDPL